MPHVALGGPSGRAVDPSCGFAILLDGEFVRKNLEATLKRTTLAADYSSLCAQIMQSAPLSGATLHRIYYYTADPLTAGHTINPLDGKRTNFGGSPVATANAKLLDELELEPNFAIRRGTLVIHGWKLGRVTQQKLKRRAPANQATIGAADIVPNIQQKGVDMRIGLDIAALALKRIVYGVVLVTGDSDMLPAMKFARREGLRVYLHTMGQSSIRRELRKHADLII